MQSHRQTRLFSTQIQQPAYFFKKINGNIWNLANNHTTDCGRAGIEQTLNIARENGVKTVGLGLDLDEASRPVIIENDGADIGIISLGDEVLQAATENSEGVVCWENTEKIAEMIKGVKKSCRFCVVVVHTGPEFAHIMPPAVRRVYRNYLKLGADVVVGHHPHVVQNYEEVGDKVIFYSLGNFIFDTDYQRLQQYTDKGVLIKLCFDKEGFSWDYQGFTIDRERQALVHSDAPDIFTNVTPLQFALLSPLAARTLHYTNKLKYTSIKPEFRSFTERRWYKYYFGKIKKSARWRGIIIGNMLYHLHYWRLADKKLQKYIKEGIKPEYKNKIIPLK